MSIPEKVHNDIARGNTASVIEAIREQPQLRRAEGNFGDTLLHRAAFYGNAELVRYLVNVGMLDINRADHTGFTPLHEAARGKSVETVKVLIELGADLKARTGNSKKTPLEIARANASPAVVQALVDADPFLREADLKKKNEAARLEQERIQRETEERLRRENHEAEIRKPVWNLTAPDEIAAVTLKPDIDCRLTEIFNFANKTYILKTQNLATKAEAVFMKTFSEFVDGDLIELAHKQYKSMSGKDLQSEGGLDKPAPATLRKLG